MRLSQVGFFINVLIDPIEPLNILIVLSLFLYYIFSSYQVCLVLCCSLYWATCQIFREDIGLDFIASHRLLYNKSQIETYQENASGNKLNYNFHTKIKRDAPSIDADKICTTIYKSTCRTIFQERDVHEDVIDCQNILQEVCKEIDENCILNCDPKCTKIPVTKCTKETKTTTKYTPETKCTKKPRKVCATRNA